MAERALLGLGAHDAWRSRVSGRSTRLVRARTLDGGVAVGALPLVVALAFVAGAAYAITSVTAQTTLLESTPADVRGRVFGVLAAIVSAGSLAPSLLAGPLADRSSTPAVIAIAGLGSCAVGCGRSAAGHDARLTGSMRGGRPGGVSDVRRTRGPVVGRHGA